MCGCGMETEAERHEKDLAVAGHEIAMVRILEGPSATWADSIKWTPTSRPQ
jgi:hypothetical protein